MKTTAWLLALLLGAAWEPVALRAQPDEGPGDDMGIEMDAPPDAPGDADAWGPRGGYGRRDGRKRRGQGFGPEGGGGGFGPRGGKGGRGMRSKAGKKIRQMMKDPEVRKVMKRKREAQRKLQKLVMAYRQEKDKKTKAKLEPEIKEALGEQFEADLAGHEIRVKMMSEELSKLEKRIKKRRQMKSKIVEKKFGELTGDDEGWEW